MAASPPTQLGTHWARVYAGVHQLKISPYSAAEEIGAGNRVTSDEFNVGGHQWTIRYYPSGCRASENHGGYVSVFLSLASAADGGVQVVGEIGLVDRARRAVQHSREISYVFRGRGTSWGFRRFARRADIASSGCLAGNCVVVRCSVRVVEKELVDEGQMPTVRVPPLDLYRDLGRVLLGDGVGADVTFMVSGQAFRAHRCVLAARSPVLCAELYGAPMREATEGVIEVHEMEPAVFKAMLHFIYNDSMPETAAADDATNMAQHLLAAADRYGLEGLSLACQARLTRHMDASTAAATYALASQHGIAGLETAVVEFLARRRSRMEALTASEGFRRLERVDPAVAEELVSRAAAARRWGSPGRFAARA